MWSVGHRDTVLWACSIHSHKGRLQLWVGGHRDAMLLTLSIHKQQGALQLGIKGYSSTLKGHPMVSLRGDGVEDLDLRERKELWLSSGAQ